MTPKQKEVLDQVHELMMEHFDASAYIVQVEDIGDDCQTETAGGWTGGMARAIGLCEIQKGRLLRKQLDTYCQDDAE